jgi:tetratricopeptide (TPR) repeat protein
MAEDRASSIHAGRDVIAGGDIVGRDKITVINNYIQQHVITPAPADGEGTPPETGDPPYKGLQYFDEADADEFFGRELLTARVAGRLSQARFLTVIGASGSGKSSLVRAGVIPALRRGQRLADGALPPAGSGGWDIRTLTPTAHPLDALAAVLARDEESVTAAAALARDLATEPRALALAAQRALSRTGQPRLLLFIDQFEEVFTLCRQPAEREAFINHLVRASQQSSVIILIALRADFYAQCSQFDGLRELVSQQQEFIGAMTPAELARAILEPAKRGGWKMQAGLVELMLDEVGAEPGALPLLSHALLETWARRRGRTLTLSGYREAGGVEGAIAATAESVFQQRLTPAQQPIARAIFLRLTELGETEASPDTRRRVPFSELMTRSTDTATLDAVLAILTEARLVTADKDEVEVAHEALIREWPTLRGWLAENREGLRRQRQLTDDAHEWEKLGRDTGALYRGAKLKQMAAWAERFHEPLSVLEAEFMQASAEQAARETAQQQLVTRSRWLARALMVAGALAVIAFGVWLVSYLNRPPGVMTGRFNIAVAQFTGGEAGQRLSQWMGEALSAELQGDANILVWYDSDELKSAQNVTIGAVPDHYDQVTETARRLNADVLVFGDASTAGGETKPLIQFYVGPRVSQGIEGLGGIYVMDRVGLSADMPEDSARQAVARQAESLAQVMLGTAYELFGQSDPALRAFAKAAQDQPGSPLFKFLLGQEFLRLAQRNAQDPSRTAAEALAQADSAETAFTGALQLDDTFTAARIGLGSVFFFRTQLAVQQLPALEDCTGGQADLFRPLLDPSATAAEYYEEAARKHEEFMGLWLGYSHLESVARVGAGTSYRLQAEIYCGLGEPERSLAAVETGIDLLSRQAGTISTAQDFRLLAQAQQTLGSLYEYQAFLDDDPAPYVKAITAYTTCIAQGEQAAEDVFLREQIIEKLCRPSLERVKAQTGGVP